MQRFTLPSAAEFNVAGNYAENLRQTIVAGVPALVPVGLPAVVAQTTGTHVCTLPDGRIVSVDADHRTISVDGTPAGTLGADFRAAMADGERIAVFTDAGVQWIAAGQLQPSAGGQIQVGLSMSALTLSISETVEAPATLKGTYPRLSGPLQEIDCRLIADAAARTLKTLSARAALRGMLALPSRVGWRIVDSEGRTVASGKPMAFGNAVVQTPLTFTATKNGSTFSITGSPAMVAQAYTLNISVGRAESEFWRHRARTLEILLWADCAEIGSVTGHFTETSGSEATLTVTPETVGTDGAAPVIAARYDLPLEGLDTQIFFTDLGAYDPLGDKAAEDFIPSAICYGGTLRAYAPAGEQGIIAFARAADPLTPRLRARICDGRILRICVPVGNSGGWNYGRNHFLAFTTAGIFAVSVDSALKSASASPVSMLGISRADAVAAATDAIYCATARGLLLRLRGTHVEHIECPLRPVAALWVETFGELLVIDADGSAMALTADGRASRRSLRVLRSFVEPAMAISAAGELLDYNRENNQAVPIVWRRRIAATAAKSATCWRSATFSFDAEMTAGLKLTISADSGGGAQRLLELTVNGPVNAPIETRYRAPRRPWLTIGVNGLLMPPARLLSVADAEVPLPKIKLPRRPTQ